MRETADLHRCVDGANAPEEFMVCPREVTESTEIREIGACLNHVIQFGARLLEKELDFLEDMDALTVHVSGRNHLVAFGRRAPRDPDEISRTYGSTVSGPLFLWPIG